MKRPVKERHGEIIKVSKLKFKVILLHVDCNNLQVRIQLGQQAIHFAVTITETH